MRWAQYNEARRYNRIVSIRDYTDIVILKYERLPGYEKLSQKDYAKLMNEKLEERRIKIVKERYSKGLGFAGREALLKTPRGAEPRRTKSSTINSHRPRVLSVCSDRRAKYIEWYFKIYFAFKEASTKYRAGDLNVEFPEGTYRPYCRYRKKE